MNSVNGNWEVIDIDNNLQEQENESQSIVVGGSDDDVKDQENEHDNGLPTTSSTQYS